MGGGACAKFTARRVPVPGAGSSAATEGQGLKSAPRDGASSCRACLPPASLALLTVALVVSVLGLSVGPFGRL
eukprot:6945013-Pyramimonas_sp.AAC.1